MPDVEVEKAAGTLASGYHFCGEGTAFDFGGGKRILFASGGEGKGLGAEIGGGGATGGGRNFVGTQGVYLAEAGDDVLDVERAHAEGSFAIVFDHNQYREDFVLVGVELAEGLRSFIGG